MKYLFTTALMAVFCSLLSFKPAPKKAVFSLKKFEKKMALVQPGLYASKYEATNLEYNEFLRALEQKGDASLLAKARVRDENWSSIFPENVKFETPYHLDDWFSQNPVVNISQEAAKMFCDWLTAEYNAYPKRAFKKVRFRLPTEEEWLTMAKSGDEDAIYPWKDKFLRKSNGQFRAAFKFIPESQQKRLLDDGTMEIGKSPFTPTKTAYSPRLIVTAPATLFEQNDLGIHNISGNAAEMLAEPGRTRGGSWRSYGYYLRLDAEDEYAGFTEPSPMIGFRYFMEVIED